jgi:hypothetical protein
LPEDREIRQQYPASTLRIGLMLNSLRVPRWMAKIIADIQASSFAKVVLIVRNATPPAPRRKPFRERLKTYWTHSLFERYRRWDRQHHRTPLDAFEEQNVSDMLHGVPELLIHPIQKGFVDRLATEDIAQIREANVDVLFRFGFRIIRGEILSCARYGVWSFHHGDNRQYRGAPPGFWEIYERNPVTGSILQVLTESLDGGRVIYRSLSATNFRSLYLNLNPIYWKTAEFAIRRLRDLHRHGWSYLETLPEFNEPNTYTKRIYRTPSTPVMIRFLLRLFARGLWRRLHSLIFTERTQWFIAYRPRSGSRTALMDRKDFRTIMPPRSRFYADPFLIRRGGKTYLFLEDFDFSKKRAVISYMELRGDGEISRPRTALIADCHLSYPFIFEYGDEVYMIPETKEQRTIELYRATRFPDQWTYVRTIAKGVLAVDSTIFQHGGKLWLFANIAVPGASTFDELHLFYADALDGKWTAHPKNPIVSDAGGSRPAGTLFFEAGRLIRPSQDCSLRYGYAIVLNEVKILSETDYREVPCGRLEPDWYPGSVCTHTYNRTEDFEVLDGMRIKRFFRFLAR